jgi:hypothetical protein
MATTMMAALRSHMASTATVTNPAAVPRIAMAAKANAIGFKRQRSNCHPQNVVSTCCCKEETKPKAAT